MFFGLKYVLMTTLSCSFIQVVTWTIATFLMSINAYLLLDFFSSEVRGLWWTSVTVIITSAYASFVIYLAFYGTSMSAKVESAMSNIRHGNGR